MMPFDAVQREEITGNFVEFIEATQRDERRKRRLRPASTPPGPARFTIARRRGADRTAHQGILAGRWL